MKKMKTDTNNNPNLIAQTLQNKDSRNRKKFRKRYHKKKRQEFKRQKEKSTSQNRTMNAYDISQAWGDTLEYDKDW